MLTPATHIVKPSTARTVFIDSFVSVPRGTTAIAPPLLSWPTKDPGDTLDFQLDIAAALVGNLADSILTLDVSIAPSNPGDLQVGGVTADGSRAIFWFSGGQNAIVYTITVMISTANGRTIQRSVLLPVLYLSVPPVPPNALSTNTGLVVTDQNGNPILAPPI